MPISKLGMISDEDEDIAPARYNYSLPYSLVLVGEVASQRVGISVHRVVVVEEDTILARESLGENLRESLEEVPESVRGLAG